MSKLLIPEPVISAGLTAVGSAANDFSASTGTFLTSSGANTLSGNVTISGSKTFATGTGAVSMNGTMTFASNKGISTSGGTGYFDFSGGTGVFRTTSGDNTFYGATNAMSPAVVTTSGARTILTLTGVADTDQTASTEKVDVDFALNRTVTFDQGVKTVQRAMVVRAPTYGFTGGEPSGTDDDINDAATFAVTGPPVAGTWTQFINGSWSIWSQSGTALFQRDDPGSSADGAAIMLENRSEAADGTQRFSPSLVWSGRGWKTDATAASQTVRYAAQLVPIQGTANPDGALIFYKSINGGAYSQAEVNGNGYFGSNDAQALGTTTTSSTTFVDVGNGSSTGFASWTAPMTKVTKTYTLHVVVRSYMPTLGSSVTTYFQVLQDGVAIASQPTATASQAFGSTSQYLQTTWRIAVPCTAGSAHVYKLQWKVGNASDSAGVSATVGTLQYYITG